MKIKGDKRVIILIFSVAIIIFILCFTRGIALWFNGISYIANNTKQYSDEEGHTIGNEYQNIPLCDLDTVIFSHDRITMTIPMLSKLVENNINVYIMYYADHDKNEAGRYMKEEDIIIINADVTKSVKETAITFIHEAKHAMIKSKINTQKEEVLCYMEEEKHIKERLTPDDIRRIIKYVKSSTFYKYLPWKG